MLWFGARLMRYVTGTSFTRAALVGDGVLISAAAGALMGSRAYTSLSASEGDLRQAEEQVLRANGALKFVRLRDTEIGEDLKIHSAHIPAERSVGSAPLVIMPGYAAGVGWYSRNIPDLHAKLANHHKNPRDVHVVDWLGTGLSSRPKFRAESVEETENFFVASLEKWRQKNHIDQMVLCGHSLGGYLAFAYAEQYPHRVKKLVLSSPAGVPHEPLGYKEKIQARWSSFTGRLMLNTVIWLWEKGVTPASFIRYAGPWGEGLVDKYISRRFRDSHADDLKHLSKYAYLNLALYGSGEYALNRILKPFAWAHKPLCDRVQGLFEIGVQDINFIYGTTDWMDHTHALEVKKAFPSYDIPVWTVPNAGHQLHVQNPSGFVETVVTALDHKQGDASGITISHTEELRPKWMQKIPSDAPIGRAERERATMRARKHATTAVETAHA
eukprot:CAMPEP_0197525528 /NCGR_PEP_ID=MMETSP1318-20131121/12854_1 /TAXON_ID=552666 /ORGANISM="Partenskyella glossopodia, Strain RCC365" /LENGTH=440 /DNA_ID=CAMNT_0043079041 /DNA_START=82 /DNA_END=1404 /DNA_ORIENTATION=-